MFDGPPRFPRPGPTKPGPHHARRISPTAEINAEYAAFVADFVLVEQTDIATLPSQDTGDDQSEPDESILNIDTPPPNDENVTMAEEE